MFPEAQPREWAARADSLSEGLGNNSGSKGHDQWSRTDNQVIGITICFPAKERKITIFPRIDGDRRFFAN